MGNIIKKSMSRYLHDARIMIENSLSDKNIMKSLTVFGYHEAKLNYGKKLYDEAVNLQDKQRMEYGEQFEATGEVNKAWDEADKIYMKSLKVARIALQGSVKANASMLINGQRKRTLSGWLLQANAFYTNLLGDDVMMVEMSEFGYNKEKLWEEYEQIKKVEVLNLKRKKEAGEARESTELRDKKMEELDKWLSDFKVIVRIAMEDSPQQMEKLGIITKRKE